jgi:hypothetical protein
MLNRNSERLNPATRKSIVAMRCEGGMSRLATSPPTRAAPTTPIGESALRGASPKAAFHRSGTLEGRSTRDWTPSSTMVPMRSTDWPKDCFTTPLAGVKPRNPALTYWPST